MIVVSISSTMCTVPILVSYQKQSKIVYEEEGVNDANYVKQQQTSENNNII